MLYAQQRVVISRTDGTKDTIPVWKVDSITFVDFEKPQLNSPGEPVDLGLKSGLKWAPWNLGAADSTEVGFLFGWGNYDYTNLSTDKKYFPAPKATSNITDTDFDVVRSYWNDLDPLWHMPTLEDFQELMACQWDWDAEKKAFRISNPNAEDEALRENFIYLPVTGQRFGEEATDSLDFGFYWSGSVAKSDSTAVYLRFAEGSSTGEGGETIVGGEQEDEGESVGGDEPSIVEPTFWQLLDGFRSRHFAVRPVYGEYKIPVTISSDDTEPEGLTATIVTHLGGEGENVRYYIAYSTVKDFTIEEADKTDAYTVETLEGDVTANFTIELNAYETTYYYRAVAEVGKDILMEETIHEFTTGADERIVDLGLSVKWASRNIGAETETGSGYYVRWGALSEIHYSYGGSGNISGNPDYDIAQAEWGDEWRMPTRAEFEELKTYCTATQEKINGVSGVRFSRGKNSIFIPFAGGRAGSTIQNTNKAGYYWTSEGEVGIAYFLTLLSPIYDDFFTISSFDKGLGYTVRAVRPGKFVENPDDIGGEGGENQGGENQGGQGGEGGGEEPPVNPVAEDVVAVDLGLTSGTLWANMNVGAEHSTEYGSFYAWGETEAKSTYLLSNYAYYNEGYDTFYSPYKGEKGIQGTDWDAAHVIWGGNWVTPTPTQFDELVEECAWTWDSENNGYKVSSKKNSNFIFLPATGYYNGSSRTAQPRGYYWTSSLYLFPADWDKAKQAMEFVIENTDDDSYKHYQMDTSRQYGLAIRPVKNK